MNDWNVKKENPDKRVAREDWGFVPLNPDPDFDPKHNQQVIDNVIRKNKALFKRKHREFMDKMGERNQAVASYIHRLANTRENTNVEQYFGKHYLAYLRGEEIINRLRHAKENQASEKTRG